MTWDALVGLPYADQGRAGAVDCWGLVRLAYASIGIELPSYAGEYHDLAEREEVAAVMSKGQGAMLPVSDPRAYDVVVFRRAGLDAHVGIVVEPGLMLHIDQTAPSRIEPYTGPRWVPRLSGFYRHRLLA